MTQQKDCSYYRVDFKSGEGSDLKINLTRLEYEGCCWINGYFSSFTRTVGVRQEKKQKKNFYTILLNIAIQSRLQKPPCLSFDKGALGLPDSQITHIKDSEGETES